MSQPRRPNIVWIFPDEWRHDALGCAGNPVVHTPHLDALAARGTRFTRAYCESPVCQPSRVSLLTGRYPSQHGKTQNGEDPVDPHYRRLMPAGPAPEPDADNILHRLRAAGYHTVGVGKMHFTWSAAQQAGYAHGGAEAYLADGTPGPTAAAEPLRAFGFDEIAEEHDKHVLMLDTVRTGYTEYLAGRGLLERWRSHQREQNEIQFGRDPAGRVAMPDCVEAADTLDGYIGGEVCRRIEQLAGAAEPFFLWAGFVGPHPPFDGPVAYTERYRAEDIPLPRSGRREAVDNRYGEYVEFCREFLGATRHTEDDYRSMGRHYYGAITMLDEFIGRIVAALDRAGIAEDTWIVFSSDHGELLGDHDLITKAVFYESAVRVPALVVPPRGADRTGGEVRDELIQGIDLAVSMLELAGADTSGLAGRSLLTAGAQPRAAVFSQIAAFSMVRTEDWKLVVDTLTLEPQSCYRLGVDPDERHELVADPTVAPVIHELTEHFLRDYVTGRPAPG